MSEDDSWERLADEANACLEAGGLVPVVMLDGREVLLTPRELAARVEGLRDAYDVVSQRFYEFTMGVLRAGGTADETAYAVMAGMVEQLHAMAFAGCVVEVGSLAEAALRLDADPRLRASVDGSLLEGVDLDGLDLGELPRVDPEGS